MSLYVVTAATSRTGSGAVKSLIASGERVRAIVHDVNSVKAQSLKSLGVEIVEGSQYDGEALSRAFDGAKAVYAMNIPQWDGMDMYEAAKAAGTALKLGLSKANVQRVVLLSSAGGQFPKGTGKIVTTHILEELLANSAPEVIYLRAAYFLENWGASTKAVKETSTLTTFIDPPTFSMPMVSTKDIGSTAAQYLSSSKTFPSPHIVNLHGPKSYSSEDIAQAFSKALKIDVKVKSVPDDQLESELGKIFPEQKTVWTEFYRAYKPGGIIANNDSFNQGDVVKGRTTAEEVVADYI